MADNLDLDIALDYAVRLRAKAEELSALWDRLAERSGLLWQPLDPAVLVGYLAAIPSEKILEAMLITVKQRGQLDPRYCVGILRNWRDCS